MIIGILLVPSLPAVKVREVAFVNDSTPPPATSGHDLDATTPRRSLGVVGGLTVSKFAAAATYNDSLAGLDLE